MELIMVLKALPYIGATILAVVAFSYFLAYKVLKKKNRALMDEIESQNVILQDIAKNIKAAEKYQEALQNNKEIADALVKEMNNAKSSAEIIDSINRAIKLSNEN